MEKGIAVMSDLKCSERTMNSYEEVTTKNFLEIGDLFVNSEVPNIEYKQLSNHRDAGIMVSILDIDGDPTSFVLTHSLVKELMSDLKTADDNLIVMNTEKF